MLEGIRAFTDTLIKKRDSRVEGISLTSFINASSPTVFPEPFPHIVIDNFFKPDFYRDVCSFYNERLSKGLSSTTDFSRFQRFLDMPKDKEYDGYLYIPSIEEIKEMPMRLFFSLSWNLFFSEIFNQPTSWSTSLALHHHPPGDRTGFLHHDYIPKWFRSVDRLQNGVFYNSRNNRPDTAEGPSGPAFREMRAISLIYYLGNNEWDEKSGGETGLYGTHDSEVPAKMISPLNNRLFAFQISPKSFHAFQTNRTHRSSIIQWFHVRPQWCEMKYGPR